MPSVFVQQPAPPELAAAILVQSPAQAAHLRRQPRAGHALRRHRVHAAQSCVLQHHSRCRHVGGRLQHRRRPAVGSALCRRPQRVAAQRLAQSVGAGRAAHAGSGRQLACGHGWVGQGGLGGTVGRRERRRRQGPARISKRRGPDGLHSLPPIASAAAMARRRCCCSVRKPLCEKGAVCGGAPLPTHRSTCQEDVEQLGGPAPSAGREVSSAASAMPFLPFQAADRAKPKLGKRATAP